MRHVVLAALCVLLAGPRAWSAAPPLRDPLPEGAIARLGHARMIADKQSELSVSPDGKYVRAAWSHYGEESFGPAQWFRLADGRDTPPIRVPEGHTLRLFTNGAHLIGNKGRFLLFAAPGDKEPAVVIDCGETPVYFDQAGRSCVKIEDGEESNELWAGSLNGGRNFRWRRIATAKKWAFGARLSAQGGHVSWIQHDEKIRVCDLATGKVTALRAKKGGKEQLYNPAISPDGKTVACLSDQRVCLFDVGTRKMVRSDLVAGLAPDGDVEFTADGKALVVPQGDRGLRIIPIDSGEKMAIVSLVGGNASARFAIFPDGHRVAVRDTAGVIRIHDLRTGKQLDPHSRFPGIVGVQMIGRDTAVCWTELGMILTWDIRSGRVLSEATVKRDDTVPWFSPLRFSADGSHVAGWTKGACLMAETKTGKVIARLDADRKWTSLDFHPAGKALWVSEICSTKLEVQGLRLKLLGPSGVRVGRELQLLSNWPGDHRYSPDGRFVLSAAGNDAILFEVATGKVRWQAGWDYPELRGGSPENQVVFDRKGRIAIVFREHGTAVFDVFTGRRLAILPGVWGNLCALSGSGRWLASDFGKHGFCLRDLHSRHPADTMWQWVVPGREATAMALDENGTRLVTAHADGTCLVWDLQSLQARKQPARKQPLSDAQLWALLGEPEPAVALPAMAALVKEPARAVLLLAGKLAPVPTLPRERVAGWIAQLGAESFERRQTAEAQLARHRESAEGQMREAASKAPLEVRLRLLRLLGPLDRRSESPAWLRQMRAVEVLERIGTREAIALLEKLSAGAPGAALTREAREALERLR